MLRWPATTAFALCVVLVLSGLLDPIEWSFIDMHASFSSRIVASDLTVVEIDPKSLRELDTWPWPRSYHARLLDNLRAAGARQIFIDIDFSSTSDPVEDKRLAESLAAFPRDRILLPVFQQVFSASAGSQQLLLTQPAALFRKQARLASITLRPERDGLVRRVPLAADLGDSLTAPATLRLNELAVAPVDELYIDFAISPASFARLSYSDVLAGDFPRELIENRRVIIGATALELGDQLAVPIHQSLSGPVLQALAYQSLHEGPLRPVSRLVTLLLMGLLSLSIARPLAALDWRKGLLTIAVGAMLLFACSGFAYSQFSLLVPLAPLLAVLAITYSCTVFSKLDQQTLRLILQRLAARRTDALMANIVYNSIEGIVTLDADGAIRNINPAACAMFGLTRSDALNRQFATLVPDSRDITQSRYTLNTETRNACVREVDARHCDGRSFPVEIAISRLSFEGEELYTAFIRNISERNAQQAALKHQATHDTLTGLGNRSLLQERLEQLTCTSCPPDKSAAVLMLDLDRFKEINDTLGHHVGDLVLEEVAVRLAAAVGGSNTLARFGGDEFAILIPACGEREEIVAVATRLLDALRKPIDANGMRLAVGGSIGIALYPHDGSTPGTLLQCADVAMYLAKRTQSGYALYDPKLDQNSLQRLTISSDLRSAIESDQLRLFYQPQVAFATGRVICVEALLRWNHPRFGTINPVDIMEIAEGTELIKPLTMWTLRTALNELADLHQKGCSIDVAVNLSARLLHDPSLPTMLQECLDEVGIQPNWLILEITESAIISDPEHALHIVRQIATMGIRLSIDDFGTGYSSLAYLKHLPACELKIDKSFVIDMLSSESDAMIVRSTIDLAHNFGMKVVAEGIENERVWHRLKQLDCDIAQGYWIARPMLLSEFRKWLVHWSNTQQTAIA